MGRGDGTRAGGIGDGMGRGGGDGHGWAEPRRYAPIHPSLTAVCMHACMYVCGWPVPRSSTPRSTQRGVREAGKGEGVQGRGRGEGGEGGYVLRAVARCPGRDPSNRAIRCRSRAITVRAAGDAKREGGGKREAQSHGPCMLAFGRVDGGAGWSVEEEPQPDLPARARGMRGRRDTSYKTAERTRHRTPEYEKNQCNSYVTEVNVQQL